MNKDEGDLLPKKQDQERIERDFEMFLQDIEEDAEFRTGVALYRKKQDQNKMEGVETASMVETEGEEGEEVPQIDISELLDDFDELGIEDRE